MQILLLVFFVPLLGFTFYCVGLGLLGLVRPAWSRRLGMRYSSGFTFGAALSLGLFLFLPPALILAHYMDPFWVHMGLGLGGAIALFFVALGTLLKRNIAVLFQLFFMSLHLLDNAISRLGPRKSGFDGVIQQSSLENSFADPTLAAAINALTLSGINIGLTCWAIDLLGWVQVWESVEIFISLVAVVALAIVYAGAAITEQEANDIQSLAKPEYWD